MDSPGATSCGEGCVALGVDEWESIAAFLAEDPDASAVFQLRRVDKQCRAASLAVTAGVDASHMSAQMNQGELCSALHLEAKEARSLPHSIVRQRAVGGTWQYDTHVFAAAPTLRAAAVLLGGWPQLAARLALRRARKRKQEELQGRRAEAAAKRRAALDAWIDAEQPLGTGVRSVAEWASSLAARGAHPPESNSVLRDFLGSGALKGPSEEEARTAALAAEAAAVAVAAKATAALARKAEVVAALAERGRQLDERLDVVLNYSRNHWHVGQASPSLQVLGQQKAILIAERIIQESDRQYEMEALAAGVPARRKALRAALRKRKLCAGSDSVRYNSFVEKGETAEGLTDAVAVAEAVAHKVRFELELKAALGAAGVSRLELSFAHCELNTFERAGTLDGAPTTAVELVMELSRRNDERRAAKARQQEERSAAEARRQQKKRQQKWRAEAVQRPRCCSTPGCLNMHRLSDPVAGPNGPVCGACEKIQN